MKDARDLPDYEFERRLNKLVRENHRYANLDSSNKKVILDMMKKFKPYLRDYGGISNYKLRRESYKLYKNRKKLGMTYEDLKDVREILGMFKK